VPVTSVSSCPFEPSADSVLRWETVIATSDDSVFFSTLVGESVLCVRNLGNGNDSVPVDRGCSDLCEKGVDAIDGIDESTRSESVDDIGEHTIEGRVSELFAGNLELEVAQDGMLNIVLDSLNVTVAVLDETN
jgi:hypothetical protein